MIRVAKVKARSPVIAHQVKRVAGGTFDNMVIRSEFFPMNSLIGHEYP
jgi:hypothetical protein